MRILALVAIALAFACDARQAEPSFAVEISQEQFLSRDPGSTVVLDVRSPEEYAAGHIKHALNIPYDRIEERLADLKGFAGAPVVLYCRTGRRAAIAAKTLAEAGFTDLRHLTGDMDAWLAAGRSVVKDGP